MARGCQLAGVAACKDKGTQVWVNYEFWPQYVDLD